MSAPATDGGVIQPTTRQSTPGARVLDAAGRRRGGADRDVRTRRRGRVTGHHEHERQPQRAQDEPEHRPEVAGHERAGEDEGYLPGFQSVSA